MKPFKQYITETYVEKVGELIFSPVGKYYTMVMPISEKMIERLFGKRKLRGYHITKPENLKRLVKLQNSAKSISTLTSGEDTDFAGGIASGGGAIVELEGNLLFSSYKDVFSNLEVSQGRRWVKLESLPHTSKEIKKIHKDITKEIIKYINKNKIDFCKDDINYTDQNTYEDPMSPWIGMHDDVASLYASTEVKDLVVDGWKVCVNGKPVTGKDKANAIKFYFDTWENYIKKNSKMFFEILFSGLDKSKGVGEKPEGITWNEHILNRFKVTHIFLNKPSNMNPIRKENWAKIFDETKKLFPKAKVTEYNNIYHIIGNYVDKRAGLIK